MNKSKKNMRKTRRFPWGKIILGLLASVVILLVAAMLPINAIANKQINQALKRYLPEGGRLEGVYIFPMRGKVSFEGLSINPPKGYGKGPILSLNSLGVDVDMSSLLGDEIVVEELTMEGLSVGLMRDKHGHLNIVKLITPIIEGPDKDVTEPEPSKAAGANSDGGEQTSVSIPAIRVQSIRFENLFVQLDDKLAGENWSAGLRIDLDVNELRLRDLLNQDILVGRINLALSNVTIDQPEGFGHVPLMAIDKIEMETPGYGIGGPRLVVSHILVDNLAASFERNKEGVVNLLKLLETFSVKTEEGNESKQGSVETID